MNTITMSEYKDIPNTRSADSELHPRFTSEILRAKSGSKPGEEVYFHEIRTMTKEEISKYKNLDIGLSSSLDDDDDTEIQYSVLKLTSAVLVED